MFAKKDSHIEPVHPFWKRKAEFPLRQPPDGSEGGNGHLVQMFSGYGASGGRQKNEKERLHANGASRLQNSGETLREKVPRAGSAVPALPKKRPLPFLPKKLRKSARPVCDSGRAAFCAIKNHHVHFKSFRHARASLAKRSPVPGMKRELMVS